jgi:hypothetical protein
MSLNKGKHIVSELNGIRCTVVESGISNERAAFLKELLQHNGFEVVIQEEVSDPPSNPAKFTLGVTDIVFNPVIAIYQKKLIRKDGKKVTPAYWNHTGFEEEKPYWLVGRT